MLFFFAFFHGAHRNTSFGVCCCCWKIVPDRTMATRVNASVFSHSHSLWKVFSKVKITWPPWQTNQLKSARLRQAKGHQEHTSVCFLLNAENVYRFLLSALLHRQPPPRAFKVWKEEEMKEKRRERLKLKERTQLSKSNKKTQLRNENKKILYWKKANLCLTLS